MNENTLTLIVFKVIKVQCHNHKKMEKKVKNREKCITYECAKSLKGNDDICITQRDTPW